MSRDGWLPPGVSDRMIDEASSGYVDEPLTEEELIERGMGLDEQMISNAVERMIRFGGRARVMDLFDALIKEHRLDRFVGAIREAAE